MKEVKPKRDILDIQAEIIAAARRVCARFDAEYERLSKEDAEGASKHYWSLVPSQLNLKETAKALEGRANEPQAMKYLRRAGGHVKKWNRFLPYLAGFKKVFEIGVGPGYLFKTMIEYYGTDMRGCDLN